MNNSPYITTMRSVADGFSYVMDTINEEVQNHHRKVAYLSYRLAEEMNLPAHACQLAIVGGLMHDIGGILRKGRLSLLDLEAQASRLARDGANIVQLIPTDAPLAEIVRNSQMPAEHLNDITGIFETAAGWIEEQSRLLTGERMLQVAQMIGQIIHLADVVTLLFDDSEPALNQVKRVRAMIEGIENGRVPRELLQNYVSEADLCAKAEGMPEFFGTDCVSAEEREGEITVSESEQPDAGAPRSGQFHPWVLQAFYALCERESVWMDLMYEPSAFLNLIPDNDYLTLDKMVMLSEFASVIIDFRSPFTARHSAGVSASAVVLARLIGMSGDECKMMKIAGNLHDVGKLKIPSEILEKPGKLTEEEFNIIKEHAYYTWKILKHIQGLGQIAEWAAFHHEKLNGNGYPFHLQGESIHLGARILAVADIFSAITEDRPYRKGMEKEQVIRILREDVERGDISGRIVELLIENYDEVNQARFEASESAGRRYRESVSEPNEHQ